MKIYYIAFDFKMLYIQCIENLLEVGPVFVHVLAHCNLLSLVRIVHSIESRLVKLVCRLIL